jgi:hypothetical protein
MARRDSVKNNGVRREDADWTELLYTSDQKSRLPTGGRAALACLVKRSS